MKTFFILLNLLFFTACGPKIKIPNIELPYDIGDWVKVSFSPECPGKIIERYGPRATIGFYVVNFYCDSSNNPTGLGYMSGDKITGYWE